MTAKPCFYEPMYLCDITGPQVQIGSLFSVLNERRGQVVEQNVIEASGYISLKAHLPIAESFGIMDALRQATKGRPQFEMKFNHWALVNGDPFDKTSKSGQIVHKVRVRKNLKEGLPTLDTFVDKL